MCFINRSSLRFKRSLQNKIGLVTAFIVLSILNSACSSDGTESLNSSPDVKSETWSIPKEDVVDGGAGKDGIPSINDPKFISINQVSYINSSDLVLMHNEGAITYIYPHKILDFHEAINNDNFKDPTSITYCPLTGTGIGFIGSISGSKTNFGISGLVYKNNQILFDRLTESYWSQILRSCVYGELKGQSAKTVTLVETTWETAQLLAPNALVLSKDTGFSRVYDIYPYLDYRTSNDFFLFPVKEKDDRLPEKERVYTIIGNNDVKTFPLALFKEDITLIRDSFEGISLLIVGSKKDQFIVSFIREPGLVYEVVNDAFPIVFKDNKGSKYTIFGRVIQGPDLEKEMRQPTAMMGYWFAFADFFGRPQIYLK